MLNGPFLQFPPRGPGPLGNRALVYPFVISYAVRDKYDTARQAND